MRRPATILPASAVALGLLLAGCQVGGSVEPEDDAATVSETLPPDAGDLENPSEVTSPGGGAGETEEDGGS